MHELVNPKLVGLGAVHALGHARLPIVVSTGAFCRFADAIPPVIAVCKTAARPAIVRYPDALHVVDELLANPADVLDFRVPPYPDSVVNNSTEMLDELPVQMRADLRTRILGSDFNVRVRSEGRADPSCGSCGNIGAGSKKAAAIHPARVNPNDSVAVLLLTSGELLQPVAELLQICAGKIVSVSHHACDLARVGDVLQRIRPE